MHIIQFSLCIFKKKKKKGGGENASLKVERILEHALHVESRVGSRRGDKQTLQNNSVNVSRGDIRTILTYSRNIACIAGGTHRNAVKLRGGELRIPRAPRAIFVPLSYRCKVNVERQSIICGVLTLEPLRVCARG